MDSLQMAETPVRLRLSRAKGFDLQAHSLAVNGLPAVNVARPSMWGNPFVVGKDGNRKDCTDLFAVMLNGYLALTASCDVRDLKKARDVILANIHKLTGNNLACWCRLDGKPCHADLLIRVANTSEKLALANRIAGKDK